MDKQVIIEKVKARTKDGKIACKQVLNISAEEGITPKEINDLLNELEIKAAHCQLGCFP